MNAPSLARVIPALGWLRAYDRSWLRSDVFAGITLAAYLLPAGLGDASPKPAGNRYAASVMPAKTSARNQLRSYVRSQLKAGTSRARDGAFIAAISGALEQQP